MQISVMPARKSAPISAMSISFGFWHWPLYPEHCIFLWLKQNLTFQYRPLNTSILHIAVVSLSAPQLCHSDHLSIMLHGLPQMWSFQLVCSIRSSDSCLMLWLFLSLRTYFFILSWCLSVKMKQKLSLVCIFLLFLYSLLCQPWTPCFHFNSLFGLFSADLFPAYCGVCVFMSTSLFRLSCSSFRQCFLFPFKVLS